MKKINRPYITSRQYSENDTRYMLDNLKDFRLRADDINALKTLYDAKYATPRQLHLLTKYTFPQLYSEVPIEELGVSFQGDTDFFMRMMNRLEDNLFVERFVYIQDEDKKREIAVELGKIYGYEGEKLEQMAHYHYRIEKELHRDYKKNREYPFFQEKVKKFRKADKHIRRHTFFKTGVAISIALNKHEYSKEIDTLEVITAKIANNIAVALRQNPEVIDRNNRFTIYEFFGNREEIRFFTNLDAAGKHEIKRVLKELDKYFDDDFMFEYYNAKLLIKTDKANFKFILKYMKSLKTKNHIWLSEDGYEYYSYSKVFNRLDMVECYEMRYRDLVEQIRKLEVANEKNK